MIKVFVCFLLIFLPACVFAYELLEPLPGVGAGNVVDLEGYIELAFNTVLALAAFLAVVKIVAGALFITAAGGSESNQTKGREMVSMALWGLLLALATVLILGEISPQFITGTL